MVCPYCGSDNVTVTVFNKVSIKDKYHGAVWWLFIGWWWVPTKWVFLTLPAILMKLFGRKKQKIVNSEQRRCVCHNCGGVWQPKNQ